MANAGALAASRAIAAVLGLGYWSVATRLFPAAAVGFAATSISAMTLLGTAGMLGIGSLLLGELPRQPGRERPLIGVGLLAAGLGGLALGTIFIGLASRLSADLTPLASSVLSGTVFALGVGLTAMGLVLIYRSSRIINFAQVEIGLLAATVAQVMVRGWHQSYFLAVPIGLAVALGTGALIDLVVVRR
ncbi:MAG: hypothetical protein JO023_04160, partial [Chloroflexi bacterium]|nr:hypothetical protein [Chloroflexota bacterium]